MDKKSCLHALILVIATVLTFFWVGAPELSDISLQLTGLLLLTLIVTHHILKPASFKLMESTVTTISVLLIVHSTGGISSPLFFLNFFLLFELSLLLEPLVPIILSIVLIFYYLLLTKIGSNPFHLLELLAFPLMTPLAVMMGNIYQKVKNQKKEIQRLSSEVDTLEEKLAQDEIKINLEKI